MATTPAGCGPLAHAQAVSDTDPDPLGTLGVDASDPARWRLGDSYRPTRSQ